MNKDVKLGIIFIVISILIMLLPIFLIEVVGLEHMRGRDFTGFAAISFGLFLASIGLFDPSFKRRFNHSLWWWVIGPFLFPMLFFLFASALGGLKDAFKKDKEDPEITKLRAQVEAQRAKRGRV